MKKAYLAIKFHSDSRNRDLIEEISQALLKANIETVVMARDYENWGEVKFNSFGELMEKTFEVINSADLLIAELSEPSSGGVFIEAGYAYAKNKPVIVIAKNGAEISNTLKGISQKIIFYNDPKELSNEFLST